jgi:hypothetical protein
MAAMEGHRLGVDFGTSTTVAVLADPTGRVRPLHFDGVELLPSAVCLDRDGTLLVGRDAVFAARTSPGGYEPNPKRTVDDGTVLLDGRGIPVVDLFAALLSRVAAEAHRVAGAAPERTVLTCPAGWGGRRRGTLLDAASAAGLGGVRLVAEPVAAASYYVRVADLPPDGTILVYDLGAGTFDATVVRRAGAGFELLATRGLSDAGGLDIDAALLEHLGTVYSDRDPDRWRRLTHPGSGEDRRAARSLREDVRTAKEILSRASATLVHVPLFDDEAPLGREQLERLARPVLARTIDATLAVVREAGVAPGALNGVFLVGGSTRIPLVATLLHGALGVAPTVLERPELAVAEGSLYAPDSAVLPVPNAEEEPAAAAEEEPAAPVGARIGPVPPPAPDLPPDDVGRHRPPVLRAVTVAVAVLALVTVTALLIRANRGDAERPGADRPTGATASASPVGCTDLPARGTPASPSGVQQLAVSADGRTLAVATATGTVSLWDTATGRGAAAFTDPGPVRGVAFSPDGHTLAVADDAGLVRLRCLTPAGTALALRGHSGRVTLLAFSRDGGTLATAGSDGTIRLWNTRTGAALATLDSAGIELRALALSPDGRTVASAGRLPSSAYAGGSPARSVAEEALSARIWDAATGRATVLPPYVGSIDALVFSPDGRRLVAAGPREVLVWDGPAGRGTTLFTGGGIFSAVEVSADGQTVLAASTDDPVQLWNATTGKTTAPPFTPAVWRGTGTYELVLSHAGQVLVARFGTLVSIYDLLTGGLRATIS